MQRFGTSTVPTHVTGLFILQSKWGEAVDSILSLREGEHPDCVRGRLAWLEDEDIDKALDLMPRRCVAERSIWQHWKKAGPKDKLGALGSVSPIHAASTGVVADQKSDPTESENNVCTRVPELYLEPGRLGTNQAISNPTSRRRSSL
jgi:hypothetical protein